MKKLSIRVAAAALLSTLGRPSLAQSALPSPSQPPASTGAPVALMSLELMREKGLISDAEYESALHGSSKKSIGRGYRLVRVTPGEPPQDLITGFMQDGKVYGRPVDVLAWGAGFLVTDDFAGVVYAVGSRSEGRRP